MASRKVDKDMKQLLSQLVRAGWSNADIEGGLGLRVGMADYWRRKLRLPKYAEVKRKAKERGKRNARASA